MPAYSYKERFVPMVKDGSKPHTIRSRRKNPAKPGDTLYHYYGLRTSNCQKLATDTCKDVKSIYIDKKGDIYLLDGRLSEIQTEMLLEKPALVINMQWHFGDNVYKRFSKLNKEEANRLAWLDGFRPDGSTKENPMNALELMQRWWQQTHNLPFLGDIIYRNLNQ